MTSRIECGSGVTLERGLRSPMPDGVSLASDHYYPAGEGPWPTLLMRQPYGRDIASTVVYAHPVYFARHGYHVVIQDVRGRGDSEGEFYPFRTDREDGAATIDWLHSHPACNGRIGMYGFSYQGMTQLLAATMQPKGLQCIAPGMTAHDLYNGWFYHQGALRLASTFGWGVQMMREDARRKGLREASARLEATWLNLRPETLYVPYGEHPAIADPALPEYIRDWVSHREDSEYWQALDVSTTLNQIAVPALHVSGWYDTYLEGSIQGYRALCEGAATEFARKNQYLIAGPWIHIPWGDLIGDKNFGPAAFLDTDEIHLRWFNHWLKDTGEFSTEPKVQHFVMGPNRWESAAEWPTETNTTLYLHSAGRANSRKGDGELQSTPPASNQARDIFVYDPEVPVLAPGGAHAFSGPLNQAAVEMGNNLLVYTTKPLLTPLQIFGQPTITLYAVTSAAFADITTKLVRVRSDGAAEFLTIGIARSAWLFGSNYAADTVHRWEFTLEPTSVLLATGECLRLEIAGCAFPLYDRNPSNATLPQNADNWNWQRSTHQILHEAYTLSALHLPILAGEFVG